MRIRFVSPASQRVQTVSSSTYLDGVPLTLVVERVDQTRQRELEERRVAITGAAALRGLGLRAEDRSEP